METISDIHQKRIARLIRDPRYWNKDHPEHAQVFSDTQRAFNDAYPDDGQNEQTSAGTVHVRSYTRTVDGKEIEVSAYDRRQEVAFHPAAPPANKSKLLENVVESELHRQMKEYAAKTARDKGDIVETEILVMSTQGVPTILDFMGMRPSGHLYAIEFKTPYYDSFTANQMLVYPFLDLGNHAVSFSPKIRSFGLLPGQPLPPICVYGVFADENGNITRAARLSPSPDC